MNPFSSALDQATAVRRGEVTALELVEMYLDRIERYNPALNAFWRTTPELAREQTVSTGQGPLAGAPASVKDLAPMVGYPYTLGSRAFEHQVAQVDHFVVSAMKRAGTPILGRTTTPEFGSRPVTEFGLHGQARNPWHSEHTPGGSSGGAAAAVAAGLCSWSHGSDGGGSVRIPASCCGVVGLKPSRGRISPGPLVGEGWAGLSTQGILTRTVDDAAAALDALAGHLPGDPYWTEPEGSYLGDRPTLGNLRIAVQTDCPAPVHPEVAEVTRSVGDMMAELGHHVTEAGPRTDAFLEPVLLVVAAGVAGFPVTDSAVLDPLNARLIERARTATAVDYAAAVNSIRNHSREVVAFWEDYDVLLTPTLTQPPHPLGYFADIENALQKTFEWVAFTYPYNCTGQPAVSLPLGSSTQGLPIGVQLVGPPRRELLLLAVCAQLEQALPWHGRHPRGYG